VVSFEGDNLAIFDWPDKMTGLWWGGGGFIKVELPYCTGVNR